MATPGVGRGRGRGRGLASLGILKPGGMHPNSSAVQPKSTIQSQTSVIPPAQNKPQTPKQNDQKPIPSLTQKKPDQKLFPSNRTPASHAPNPTNGQSGQKPPSSSTTPVSNAAAISKLLENVENMKKSVALSTLPSKILELCPNEQGASDFTKIICEKAVNDAEFATLGAQLCNACWMMGSAALLRTPLLITIQDAYKKRQQLSQAKFHGLTVFLCELYGMLTVKGQTLKPLNKPVCELLQELLTDEKLSEDSIFYFFQEMEKIGSIIEDDNKVNLEELINRMREVCIYNEKLLPSSKCRLVQIIELHAASWKLPSSVSDIYDDMSQDLMANGR